MAHHRTYERVCEEISADLAALCTNHHKAFHAWLPTAGNRGFPDPLTQFMTELGYGRNEPYSQPELARIQADWAAAIEEQVARREWEKQNPICPPRERYGDDYRVIDLDLGKSIVHSGTKDSAVAWVMRQSDRLRYKVIAPQSRR